MIKQFFAFVFFFFTKSALFIRSGKFLFGLVKKICLPDRMSGKDLNTFANTAFGPARLVMMPARMTCIIFKISASLLPSFWNLRLNNPVSVTRGQRLNRVTSLIYWSQPIWTRWDFRNQTFEGSKFIVSKPLMSHFIVLQICFLRHSKVANLSCPNLSNEPVYRVQISNEPLCCFTELFPQTFEGGKFIVSKPLTSHFQVSHTFNMSMLKPAESGYRFGVTYIGSKQLSPQEVRSYNLKDKTKNMSHYVCLRSADRP